MKLLACVLSGWWLSLGSWRMTSFSVRGSQLENVNYLGELILAAALCCLLLLAKRNGHISFLGSICQTCCCFKYYILKPNPIRTYCVLRSLVEKNIGFNNVKGQGVKLYKLVWKIIPFFGSNCFHLKMSFFFKDFPSMKLIGTLKLHWCSHKIVIWGSRGRREEKRRWIWEDR